MLEERNDYYSNGKLKEKYFYKDGKKNGEYTSYYENGNLKEKGYYEIEEVNNIDKRRYMEHFDYIPLSSGRYIISILDGEYLEYYENGNLKEKSYYKHGYYNGECLKYYENGNLKEKSYYKYGILTENV